MIKTTETNKIMTDLETIIRESEKDSKSQNIDLFDCYLDCPGMLKLFKTDCRTDMLVFLIKLLVFHNDEKYYRKNKHVDIMKLNSFIDTDGRIHLDFVTDFTIDKKDSTFVKTGIDDLITDLKKDCVKNCSKKKKAR